MPVKKVTFETAPIVWIIVKGELVNRDSNWNRDDGGLIARLLEFLDRSGIHPAGVGKLVFFGSASFGVHALDAPAVLAWLATHGALEQPQTIISRSPHIPAAPTPEAT